MGSLFTWRGTARGIPTRSPVSVLSKKKPIINKRPTGKVDPEIGKILFKESCSRPEEYVKYYGVVDFLDTCRRIGSIRRFRIAVFRLLEG